MELYGITLINGRKSMGFTGRYFTPRFSWSYGRLLLSGRDSQLWKIRLKITLFGASVLSNRGFTEKPQ